MERFAAVKLTWDSRGFPVGIITEVDEVIGQSVVVVVVVVVGGGGLFN